MGHNIWEPATHFYMDILEVKGKDSLHNSGVVKLRSEDKTTEISPILTMTALVLFSA